MSVVWKYIYPFTVLFLSLQMFCYYMLCYIIRYDKIHCKHNDKILNYNGVWSTLAKIYYVILKFKAIITQLLLIKINLIHLYWQSFEHKFCEIVFKYCLAVYPCQFCTDVNYLKNINEPSSVSSLVSWKGIVILQLGTATEKHSFVFQKMSPNTYWLRSNRPQLLFRFVNSLIDFNDLSFLTSPLPIFVLPWKFLQILATNFAYVIAPICSFFLD